MKDQILSAWKMIGGRWVQEGLLREYEKQRQYSESRRSAAEARWGKKDAYALRTDCIRNALHLQSSSSDLREEKIAGSTSSEPADGAHSRKGNARRIQLADDGFIESLKANPAYLGIDIDRELGKLQAWISSPKGRGKQLTQNRFLSWLNRIDRPMQISPKRERLPL